MTPVALFELMLLLLASVVVLELLARRLHLPPAAAFVLGGGALALVPGTPGIALDPDLVLVLFLPPLLMSSAHYTAWRDFRANLRIIVQLAVGAVAFTTLVVGVVAHLVVPGLPWAACFALGAIVSPPDAVAAKAVLAGLRLPRRIVVLLEGESLVNDATGIVLFRFAVAAAMTGTFSWVDAAGSFVLLAAGGIAAGLAVGFAGAFVLARLRDPHLALVFTLLLSWTSYIGAEAGGSVRRAVRRHGRAGGRLAAACDLDGADPDGAGGGVGRRGVRAGSPGIHPDRLVAARRAGPAGSGAGRRRGAGTAGRGHQARRAGAIPSRDRSAAASPSSCA